MSGTCTCIKGQISKGVCPDITVFLKDGTQLDISEIRVTEEGKISSVVTRSGDEYEKDSVNVIDKFLEVPGVGFLKPGTIIKFRGHDYVLNYGEHVNVSNQNLISWYLTSTSDKEEFDSLGRSMLTPRTLYLDMINEIDLITV